MHDEPNEDRTESGRMVSKLIRIAFFLISIPLPYLAFMLLTLLVSISIEVFFDLPVDNAGIAKGSGIAGLAASIYIFLLLFGLARRWRWLLMAGVMAVLSFTVFFSVKHNSLPPLAYIGSSEEEIYKILHSTDTPPVFLIEMNGETRPCHLVTQERELRIYFPQPGPGSIEFSVGTPEVGDAQVWLEVSAIASDSSVTPIFRSAPLAAGLWQEISIPDSPSRKAITGIKASIKVDDRDKMKAPWIFLSQPSIVPPVPPSKPNVILICVDTFRADHLTQETAPYLYSLQQQSIAFTQAVAPSSWTLPSTVSILTGLLPHEHGYLSNISSQFKGNKPSLPEIFQKEGYVTMAVSGNRLIDPRYGLDRGFDRFVSLGRRQQNYHNSGRILTLKAIKDLQSIGNRPFFLYLHYVDPHYPYLAPWPDTFLSSDDGLGFRIGSFLLFYSYDTSSIFETKSLTEREAEQVIARYNGEIRYWDRQLQTLMDFLKAKAMLNNTIIIITADHGEAFGEHDNYKHGNSLYGEEINIPLIIHDGRSAQKRTISTPLSSIEISTIIAELAGLQPAPSWKGRTLKDFDIHESGPDNRPVASILVEQPLLKGPEYFSRPNVSLSARQGWEKIITHYDPKSGAVTSYLYSLDKDPTETHGVLLDSDKEKIFLYQWIKDHLPQPDTLSIPPKSNTNKQKLMDLRDLGYIQ
ncbi:MAG TPA: sulfatase-like hydrolase/transferase [bacterium]|nr:sulfatase-like hydrolase/transferase [bacterium]